MRQQQYQILLNKLQRIQLSNWPSVGIQIISSKNERLRYIIISFYNGIYIALNLQMKGELIERPLSKRLRAESATTQKKRMGKQQAQDFFKKGKAEQLKEQYSQAIDLYFRAILYNPNYFQAYCNLGSCYRLMGKYNQAKNNYLMAINLKKDDAITHYNIANLYRKIGNYDLAIKHYEFVIRLKEDKGLDIGSLYIDSMINIGICFKNRGLYEDAITIYEKVNQIQPNDQGGLFNHAMCIIGALQRSFQQFHELAKQRADKVDQLLKKVLLINANNYMARLAQIKLSYLINPQQEVIVQSIQSLKQLLQIPNCNILNEINQQLGYCLNFSKKYKESAKFYDKAVNSQHFNRSNSLNVYNPPVADLFKSFEDSPTVVEKQMIDLMQRGEYETVQNYINSLDQSNPLQPTLKLILNLKLAQSNPNYYQYADRVYAKYFATNGENIPFDKISIQGHKAISQVLTHQKKYEEAVAHYEYLSQKLKNNAQGTAQLHSSLGDGFEAVGDMSKALEQHKRAYELEPDNFCLAYNIGSCLYENGRYKQAFQYFTKVLQAIQKDPQTDLQTKNIYTADCLITMAFCSVQSNSDMSSFEKAFTKLQTLKSSQIPIELDQNNLFDFYAKMAELFETKIQTSPRNETDHKKIVQNLLSVYESMLQSDRCLDRNQILFNCGNLYYQSKLYLTAIEAYQQISDVASIPYGNISLAYLHLIEPALAIKYIQLTEQKSQQDLITDVNRDIISWIYSNDNSGRWNSKLPQIKKDLFYERNQYGIALIDKLTIKINEKSQLSDENIKLIIEALFQDDLFIQFYDENQNIKFSKIKQIIFKNKVTSQMPTSDLMSGDLLKASFYKSEHVAEDFTKLIEMLMKLPQCGKQQEISEAAIYLYIYYNQYESNIIKDTMTSLTKIDKQQISLNLDKLISSDEDKYSIEPNYDSVKKLIMLLREWQCVLEKKTITIIKQLEKIYYVGPIYRPFQIQYHFPRHSNLRECDQTFQKLMFIILKIIEYNKKVTCKGNNLIEMKNDLIKQFQVRFNSQIKFETLKPITFTNDFILVTLYSYHQSRKDCENFINLLIKLSSDRANVYITDCEEFVVTINKIVQVRCRWYNPYSLKNIVREVMENIVEDPLYIVNQAIVALQKIREVVKEDGELGAKFINQDSTLRF